ncbi:MAG: tryptophan synthase subunit alpha, partial [Nitriliruptoraceae bacterium]|nr:tryptophan synthase subunit alpha [Nitriliruptoraceae bacterium]
MAAAFARARAEDRAALVVYLTAGFPDLATSKACFEAAAEAGADILEIGIPFSDPMMDGPVIQAANQVVLDAGIGVSAQLQLVRDLDHLDVPKLAMTYVTIADTRGYGPFADELADADLSGVILPDLPVAEAAPGDAPPAAPKTPP